MARHGENIFIRKDGRWEARIPCGKNSNGKTKYRSLYGKTYSIVKKKKTAALQSPTNPRQPCIRFEQVIERWLDSKQTELKEQTLLKYQHCIEKHILPELGTMRTEQISSEIINGFLKKKLQNGRLDMQGGLSASYVRGISIIIQSALRFAFKNQLGSMQPVAIQKPKEKKKEILIVKGAEQASLEAYLMRDLHGGNLAIYLALYTGLRIGELCALKWEDVDFSERKIVVRSTVIRGQSGVLQIGVPKSKTSYRTVPMTDHIAKILHEEQCRSNSDFLFTAPKRGSFMIPRTLQYHYRSVMKKVGIPKLPFHALRHTFATRWIECGLDVKSLSEILGHSNVKITLDYYVHSSDSLKRESMERLEKINGQKYGQLKAGSVV